MKSASCPATTICAIAYQRERGKEGEERDKKEEKRGKERDTEIDDKAIFERPLEIADHERKTVQVRSGKIERNRRTGRAVRGQFDLRGIVAGVLELEGWERSKREKRSREIKRGRGN